MHWTELFASGSCRAFALINMGGNSPGDKLSYLDRHSVSDGAIPGTVQPFGKPCKVSPSSGVSRRTDKCSTPVKIGGSVSTVFASRTESSSDGNSDKVVVFVSS